MKGEVNRKLVAKLAALQPGQRHAVGAVDLGRHDADRFGLVGGVARDASGRLFVTLRTVGVPRDVPSELWLDADENAAVAVVCRIAAERVRERPPAPAAGTMDRLAALGGVTLDAIEVDGWPWAVLRTPRGSLTFPVEGIVAVSAELAQVEKHVRALAFGLERGGFRLN